MMNDALKHLVMADAPAARDANFEIAVLARIEQRRFWRGLAGQAALAVMAAIVLALVMPVLQPAWESSVAAAAPLLRGHISNLAIGLVLMGASVALPLLRRVD
jgi:hypothetical protein